MKIVYVRMDVPCILVDASYYVFYRFFETLKHYNTVDTTAILQTDTLHENVTFLKRMYQDMDNDVCNMLRYWKTVPNNLFFCRDCARKTIWRNDHIDAYKTQRPTKRLFNPNMFSVISQYCKDRCIQMIGMDRLEADDLIALTKRKLRALNYQSDIVMITNDNDYLQLLDDRTHAFNMNTDKNDLRLRSCGDSRLDLRIKVIMGDRSDNIPPIQPNIGPKKALKLAQLPDTDFNRFLSQHNCREAYERNRQIIDFNAIDGELVKEYDRSIVFELYHPRFPVY
jgi:5'-3' exonuclease